MRDKTDTVPDDHEVYRGKSKLQAMREYFKEQQEEKEE